MVLTMSQTCLIVSLGMMLFSLTNGSLRADLLQGFQTCPGKQLGRIISVEVDGPGCVRRNGQDQWPCFLYPGREGVYKVTFTHDQRQSLSNIKSSIHVLATFRGFFSSDRSQRLPMSGQLNKDACQAIGCPVSRGTTNVIERRFTVTSSIRKLQQNMKVEFKLTTGQWRKETVICFIVPVINQ